MLRKASALTFLSFLGMLASAMAQREIPSVANSVADEVAASGKKSVAVVDFTDLQGNVTELGRFVAEELALGLVTSKKGLSVVDRTHLKAILQEHKLGSSGLIDPATARKLGQITGVEALVTGSMTVLGDSVRLVVKALDTNTARILAAASVDIAKTKTIEELMSRDIRADSSPQATRQAPSSRDGPSTPGNVPVFQSTLLRATIGQIGVAPNNQRVGLGVTIENISRNAVYLAFIRDTGRSVQVTDDVATDWDCRKISGINVVSTYETPKQSVFTVIAPAERLTVVINCDQIRGGATPGTTFSFGARGAYFTPSGVQSMAIGLAGIKVAPAK